MLSLKSWLNRTDGSITRTKLLRIWLPIFAVVGLAVSPVACTEDGVRDMESVRDARTASARFGGDDNRPDRRSNAPIVDPERSREPPGTTGVSAATPIAVVPREATSPPTPSKSPPPAMVPEPTATVPPPPISLSLSVANDQSHFDSPTATWTAQNAGLSFRYELAVGSISGGTDVLNWKSVGEGPSYQLRDGFDGVQLLLNANRDYYLTVRAVDDAGDVLATTTSQAWFVYAPYTFAAERYPAIMQRAPDSFWGVRHPDPRYTQWDENFEAYVAGSGILDLYERLGERVLSGSAEIKILQTEGGYPGRADITRLGPGEADSGHADTVSSMLYDCEVADSRQSYYRGCQVNAQKFAMTSSELGVRLNELVPLKDDSDALEIHLFGGMGSPHVWAMPHAHPTSIQSHGDYDLDQITSLRLGDWIFDQFNILAISPQPGGYAGHENPTLSGNYYNSIVAGKKSYNYSYPAQSSIDNTNGARHKPDIVVAASNLSEASSWSVPTLAAAAAGYMALAHAEPLLSGATNAEALKAIILAGASKHHLCPESVVETTGFCNGLPSPWEQWQWFNTETAPLDPTYGVGLFNYRNSFDILATGRSIGGHHAQDIGWDTQILTEGQGVSYKFTATRSNDEFSLALTWNRDITVDPKGSLTSHLADLAVALLDANGLVIARSDDPGNNIEHIYVPDGLTQGQNYTIAVTAKTSESPVRYGLAWQSRESAFQHDLWRSE